MMRYKKNNFQDIFNFINPEVFLLFRKYSYSNICSNRVLLLL
jgi:hypothetical protein